MNFFESFGNKKANKVFSTIHLKPKTILGEYL